MFKVTVIGAYGFRATLTVKADNAGRAVWATRNAGRFVSVSQA